MNHHPDPTKRPEPTRQLYERVINVRAQATLQQAGIHPTLARILAARGIETPEHLNVGLDALIPFSELLGIEQASDLLVQAIQQQEPILVIADYDCDGATACAVAVRGLSALGARVQYCVPNRFEYGYGLTPEIVDFVIRTIQPRPRWLITVDNGIASFEGIDTAKAAGMGVIVTDHHLPADRLPNADAIVNPNQPGCPFPSKSIAGVGVMFYVLIALRAKLRAQDCFSQDNPEPNLAQLLDLVALGTVADVVNLDQNNRILVAAGLQRITKGQAHPGIQALFNIAHRSYHMARTTDLGFAIGPRINAAGRLDDMSIGIECLLSDTAERANAFANMLSSLNQERRDLQNDMLEQAMSMLPTAPPNTGITLFHPDWHQGVVGILAGRVKELLHVPVIAFARYDIDEQALLRGSGRSINNIHLRDVLDWVEKQNPGLLLKFGGHAAAAGLTLRESDLPLFETCFQQAVIAMAPPNAFKQYIETDGELSLSNIDLTLFDILDRQVWGQGFPAPLFHSHFTIDSTRILKERHLKHVLRQGHHTIEGLQWNSLKAPQDQGHAVFKLHADEFRGVRKVSLIIEAWL